MDQSQADPQPSFNALHKSLLARAHALLAELAAFAAFLQSKNKEPEVEIRILKNAVIAEKTTLQRFRPRVPEIKNDSNEEGDAENLQVLYSSNLSFYEAVWTAAKGCHGVKAFRKRLHWGEEAGSRASRSRRREEAVKDKSGNLKQSSVFIDIIAEDGLEWIKVSTVTEKRLIHEMAKEGWHICDLGPDSDFDSDDNSGDGDKEGCLELVKVARDMQRATKAFRVRGRHPKVRFILPRITEGALDAVDVMIADMRATGAVVKCRNQMDPTGDGPANGLHKEGSPESFENSTAHLSSIFEPMVPSTLPHLTSTLNLDCTILLALISDITHLRKQDLLLKRHDGYHTAVTRQIEAEAQVPILRNEIYPVLDGRDLVCTMEAAGRMREIVETMGSDTERKRAEIFFDKGVSQIGQMTLPPTIMNERPPETVPSEPDPTNVSRLDQLLSLLAPHTAHPIPDLHLPIREVHLDADAVLTGSTPAKHLPVSLVNQINNAMSLSDINKSVLFYGWDEGIVTVTSNGTVVKDMDRTIGVVLDNAERLGSTVDIDLLVKGMRNDQNLGPEAWVCSTARSLIGKDKRRGGGMSGAQENS